jgi:DNA-binding NarL/FixJ family response regulator
MTLPLPLLLVDDDPFTLVMLTNTFQTLGFTDIAQADSVNEALVIARSVRPRAAVVDLDLGEGPTGIDLAHGLRHDFPHIGIVILSTYADPRLIGSRQQPLPDRAIYVVKQSISDTSVLLNAVTHSVVHLNDQSTSLSSTSEIANLGDVQVDIMRLIAAGMANAQIAQTLIMQEASVEKAIARLIKQLGVKATRNQNQRVLIAQEYYRMTKASHESR